MFVSIILDTQYAGNIKRSKWFLKNVFHALKNDILIITHELLVKEYCKICDECSERFYDQFDMERVSFDDFKKLNVAYIPDSFFEQLYRKDKTRSAMLVDLSRNRNMELEGYITKAIESVLQKSTSKKVEGFLNCMQCFESVRFLANKYNCPLIPYNFSAIRRVHGYQQTLYMACPSPDLWNHDEYKKLYASYEYEKLKYPVLTREEILAFLGKKRNLPLIQMLNDSGLYEVGLALESVEVDAHSYDLQAATDEDLFYEVNRHFPSQSVISRLHPMRLDKYGFSRKHMQNDPVNFILSCRRLATIQSQMLVKAILWNRTPCIMTTLFPFYFLCTQDIEAEDKVSDEDLNFLLFACFIPEQCMFDMDYWRWRIDASPSANELIELHLEKLISALGYQRDLLTQKDRFHRFLTGRGLSKREIDRIKEKHENYAYGVLLSKLIIFKEDKIVDTIYCVNEKKEDVICSTFSAVKVTEGTKMVFCPLDDVDGFVSLCTVYVEGQPYDMSETEYQYLSKGKGFDIPEQIKPEPAVIELQVHWKWRKYDDLYD